MDTELTPDDIANATTIIPTDEDLMLDDFLAFRAALEVLTGMTFED